MTNEEAKEIIECREMIDAISDRANEALDMAIKALEQEPCEDAISRQAVLDYIDKMPSELTADGRRMIRRRTLEEYISDTLPPVTPQPKIGHWIDMGDFEKCSVCNGTHLKEFQNFYGKGIWVKTNYCPNCGAKMEVEE